MGMVTTCYFYVRVFDFLFRLNCVPASPFFYSTAAEGLLLRPIFVAQFFVVKASQYEFLLIFNAIVTLLDSAANILLRKTSYSRVFHLYLFPPTLKQQELTGESYSFSIVKVIAALNAPGCLSDAIFQLDKTHAVSFVLAFHCLS